MRLHVFFISALCLVPASGWAGHPGEGHHPGHKSPLNIVGGVTDNGGSRSPDGRSVTYQFSVTIETNCEGDVTVSWNGGGTLSGLPQQTVNTRSCTNRRPFYDGGSVGEVKAVYAVDVCKYLTSPPSSNKTIAASIVATVSVSGLSGSVTSQPHAFRFVCAPSSASTQSAPDPGHKGKAARSAYDGS